MHKWAIMGPLEARCFKVDLRVKARVRVLSGWSLLAKLIVMMIEAEAPESACLFSAYEKEEQAIIDPHTHTHTDGGRGGPCSRKKDANKRIRSCVGCLLFLTVLRKTTNDISPILNPQNLNTRSFPNDQKQAATCKRAVAVSKVPSKTSTCKPA